jgi:hypothetical protein
VKGMKKEQLKIVRIIAIIFSCTIASLTLCNLITFATQGVSFELPEDENDIKIAYDPVNNDLLFITDFAVNNQGTYDIDDIDIKAKLYNENGVGIIDFYKKDLVVSRGCNKKFDLIISLDLDKISILEWLSLIYNDTYFRLVLDVDASYMFNLIDVTVDEEVVFPWTSPLTNFFQTNTIIQNLFTLIEHSVNKSPIDIIKEYDLVEEILKTSHYNFSYGNNYNFELYIINTSVYTKIISTKIEAYLPKIKSSINLEFNINLTYNLNKLFLKIEEVKINLCQQEI